MIEIRKKSRLLLIDDGEHYADIIKHMPEYGSASHWNRQRANDGIEAVDYLDAQSNSVDLYFDMRFDVSAERLPLPEVSSLRRQRRYQGVAILRELKTRFPQLPVVVLTSLADLSVGELASELESLSLTYMLKGDDLDALRIRIHEALADASSLPEEDGIFWGRDETFRKLRRRMAAPHAVACQSCSKERQAPGKLPRRALHSSRSGRQGPVYSGSVDHSKRVNFSASLRCCARRIYWFCERSSWCF